MQFGIYIYISIDTYIAMNDTGCTSLIVFKYISETCTIQRAATCFIQDNSESPHFVRFSGMKTYHDRT